MPTPSPKRMHWMRHVDVLGATTVAGPGSTLAARERLVAALADRPRTVAQLAQQFGLSQPTMLEQVRRALRDGLILEAHVPNDEKRYPSERYYTPAVPVIRQPDREILEIACQAIADDLASSLARNQTDLHAAFAMTHVARDGWQFVDLWPYVQNAIVRLSLDRVSGIAAPVASPHGLAWVEEMIAEPHDGTSESKDREEVA